VVFTQPTDVADADLMAVLADGWGLDVVSLGYLAVGFGSHHWQATTASIGWFVTVDDLIAKRREPDEAMQQTYDRLVAALTTAVGLRDAGLEFVVAPMRTTDGDVVRRLGDRYVVAVYPLVPGETYDYGNYTDATHRDDVVSHLATLHRSPSPCRRWAWTDTFSISRRAELFAACSNLHDVWDVGPFAEPARQLLARHADAVAHLFDVYDGLAAVVAHQDERFVLTHGEPHVANTITTDRGVVLVDWDTALIAPPERDLWDLIGEEPSIGPRYEALTGTRVDREAIEMYRLAWDLSEISIYVSDFRNPHQRTHDTEEAWQNLQHFLDPTRW
jgi:spectinomycin phosphotransferase/16S rRNA (guanine(1405)-N(7))-methyltransferase